MGTVGIRKSTSETLADKRKFWKHDAFVAVPGGDMMAHVFTYGGPNSAATAEGIYFLTARVVFGSMPTGAVNHQTVRFTCFFPTCHPRLTKTPMPPAGRHVALQGVLNDIDEDRGLVYIQDISFTHTGETIQAEAPSSKLKHFDWYGKGKQKRVRYAESTEENAAGPSGLSSK